MQDDLEAVLALQSEWSQSVTPAMESRGRLIREAIPAWLRENASSWNRAGRYEVEGSDGKGRKALTPWVRVFDPELSPSATTGWYVVYLFGADGERVYLALMQATTTWEGKRSPEELRSRADWARNLLADSLAARPDLVTAIDLGSSGWRPRSYEIGTVAAFVYSRTEVPAPEVLVDDLAYLVNALGSLPQGDEPAEVADAVAAVNAAAGGRRAYGRRLSAAQRVAIEHRAVEVVTRHLTAQGYDVKDVGATHSFDLDARRGRKRLFVEVKGTTSVGEEVVLTKAEVELHLREYPNTMLAIVSGIELDGDSASGGALRVIHPWQVDRARLDALAYRYAVPTTPPS